MMSECSLQADLALFYIPLPKGLGEIGERWERSSYLQALGFLILVAGTLVYGRGDEELDKQEVSSLANSRKCLVEEPSQWLYSRACWQARL